MIALILFNNKGLGKLNALTCFPWSVVKLLLPLLFLLLLSDCISNISVLGLPLKSARKLLFLRNVANHRIITFIVLFMQPDVIIKEAAGSSRKSQKTQ